MLELFDNIWSVYLDTQNRVISERCVTVGLLNSSLVHPREVFAPAIAHAAASVVLAHNHPSDNLEVSREDREMHSRLERLLEEVFGIERLALVYGWSMGGQQALHWGALHPDRVAAIWTSTTLTDPSDHSSVYSEPFA